MTLACPRMVEVKVKKKSNKEALTKGDPKNMKINMKSMITVILLLEVLDEWSCHLSHSRRLCEGHI